MAGAGLRRWAIRAAATAGLLATFVLSAALGVVLHADVPVARRLIGRFVGDALSAELEGRARIDALDHIGRSRVRLPRITLFDRYDQPVLVLSDVRVELPLVRILVDALFGGGRLTVIVNHVRIERADAEIVADPVTGEPTIARAIAPRARATPGGGPGARVYLPAVEIGRLTARARLRGQPPLEAEIQKVQGQLLATSKGVAVDVRRFGAVLRGFGQDARGTGTLSVRAPGPARGTFEGFFGDVELKGSVFVDGQHVEASIDVPGAAPAAMARALPGWPLRETIAGHVELKGDLPALSAKASLVAGKALIDVAGPVVVAKPESARLEVRGRHLDARTLVDDAPPTDISFDATVALRVEGGLPVAQVTAHTEPLFVLGQRVPALDVDATVKEGAVAGRVTAHEPGLPVEASFQLSKAGVLDVDAVAASADFSKVEREPLDRLTGRGPTHVSLHLENRVAHGTVDARLAGFSVGDVRARSATLKGSFVVPVDAPEKATGTAHMTGDGTAVAAFALGKVTLNASGGTERLKFDAAGATEDGTEVRADGVALLRGTPRVEAARVSFRKDPVVIEGEITALDLDTGSVEIRNLGVRGAGGSITGALRLGPEVFELEAEGENVDLDALAKAFSLPRGTLGGRLRLSANVVAGRDVTRGRVSLGLGNGTLGMVQGLSLQASANLEGEHVTGEASGLIAGLATFGASWDATLGGPPLSEASWRAVTGTAELQVSDVLLPVFRVFLADDGPVSGIDGRVYARLLFERRNPTAPLPSVIVKAATRKLVVDLRTKDPDAPLRVEGVDLSVTAGFDGTTGEATGTTLVLDDRGELLSASGRMQFDVAALLRDPAAALSHLSSIPLDANISMPARPIREIPAFLSVPPLAGDVAGTLNLRGSLAQPTLFASLNATGLGSGDGMSRPVDVDAEGQYEWNTDEATVRARATSGGAVVATAAAKGTLPGGDPSRWTGAARATLAGLPLDLLGALGAAKVLGRVSGTADLARTAGGGSLAANLTIADASVAYAALGPGKLVVQSDGTVLNARLGFVADRGKLDADATTLLDFTGPVPALAPGAPIRARVVAKDFAAAVLSPLVEGVLARVGGRLDADLTLKLEHARKEPPRGQSAWSGSINGTARLREGTALVDMLGLDVRDIAFDARATAQGATTLVTVPNLSGRVRATKDNLHGSADLVLEGIRVVRGTGSLRADDLPVLFRGAPQGRATGIATAKLERTLDEMRVDVEVPKLVLRLPQSSSREVIDLEDNRDVTIVQFATDESARSETFPWRLAFTLGRDVAVLRQDVSLGVTGTPVVELGAETDVTGTVELTPGSRIPILLGKVFFVERGRVIFDTGEPTNPRIDVSASVLTPSDTRVYAEVTGTLKEAKISFHSDPPLPEAEAFALLFGGQGDTGASESSAETSGSAASGAAAVGGNVGAAGLNQLFLSNSPVELRVDQTRDSQPRYTAAVRIQQNLWFEASTYQQQSQSSAGVSEGTSVLAGTVDYRFSPKWSLRTEVGTSGGALDLLWQYRY